MFTLRDKGSGIIQRSSDGDVAHKALIDLAQAAPSNAGGKAAGVRWLIEQRVSVPRSWAVDYDTVSAVTAGAELSSPTLEPLAVRSSANREDGSDSSLAGQLHSAIDVAPGQLSEAIRSVHASALSDEVQAYLARVPGEPIRMGVLVQEMVFSEVSGVSFSRNPVTGLNEVVIEAVAGSGLQLVQGGVTPERWVHRWNSWTERPASPVLPEEVAGLIATETAALARNYGRPADLEWVWDGERVWWIQIRPIVGAADIDVYSNRISREVLPGLVKPLVWSVNVPVVNGAWIRLISDAIGPNDLRPDDLARQFAYRAYFNMGTMGRIFEQLGMPRDLLEVLLGLEGEDKPSFRPSTQVVRHLPRMLTLAARLLRHARTARGTIADLERRYAAIPSNDLPTLTEADLLERARHIMGVTEDAAYLNIVTPLLANLWAGRLRSLLKKQGVDPAGIDISDGVPSPHDPSSALRVLSAAIGDAETSRSMDADPMPGLLAEFLERFGHFSDSGNDFSVPTWAEDPGPLLATLRSGPIDRQGGRRFDSLPDPSRRLRATQRRAVTYQHLRDEVSSLYTAGYGRLRPVMLEVGKRLAEQGILPSPEDVFFATLDELGSPPADLAGRVARRADELDRVRDVTMPETIFGDTWSPVTVASAATLAGLGTSRGQHHGTARVVRGVEDGSRVENGDVLVIPFSDVGWTPLFLKAGAVVSESGGMLSHASIVARELGIPCVVSVDGAMAIPDGVTVWVDGLSGQVVVEE